MSFRAAPRSGLSSRSSELCVGVPVTGLDRFRSSAWIASDPSEDVERDGPPVRGSRTALSLLRDRRGANLVEYIILVGVIALIALAGFRFFGKTVTNKVEEQGNKVNQIGH
jgi:pilus assembly protein Flp/PilA